MAKALKTFKNKIVKPKAIVPEIMLDDAIETSTLPVKVDPAQTIGPQVKLLDQLEKAGFAAIAGKLRELQLSEGLDQLDPMVKRLTMIEEHIDKLLNFGAPIDTEELQRLLNMLTQAYQARAKALLLPYGSVSPRTALQGNRGNAGSVSVAIGIGQGVTPRPKK